MNPFASLGLSTQILDTISQLGFQVPTEIQKEAIPRVMAGHDLLAVAQTGTGKTAAYLLPTIERIKRYANQSTSPAMHPIRMLILVPTRELAQQVQDNIALLVNNIPLKYAVLFGGTNINLQIDQLRSGVEILVATVGRLKDLIEQRIIKLNQIEIVVLDEADKMLDIGFFDDIHSLFKQLPVKKQTVLFSATFSKAIERLSQEFLQQPERVEVTPKNTTNTKVEQHFIGVDHFKKKNLLKALIDELNMHQVLIFCNTKTMVEKVTQFLNQNNLNVLAIHGDKSQNNRTETMMQFKQGTIQALVATNVAARGLDIHSLPFVINYDLPLQAEDYVHRIGRTGRAGSSGIAISLVEETELEQYQHILALTQQTIEIKFVEHYEPRWKKTQPVVQPKSSKSKEMKPTKSLKNVNSASSRRKKRTLEDCALLLPNYGAINLTEPY